MFGVGVCKLLSCLVQYTGVLYVFVSANLCILSIFDVVPRYGRTPIALNLFRLYSCLTIQSKCFPSLLT